MMDRSTAAEDRRAARIAAAKARRANPPEFKTMTIAACEVAEGDFVESMGDSTYRRRYLVDSTVTSATTSSSRFAVRLRFANRVCVNVLPAAPVTVRRPVERTAR